MAIYNRFGENEEHEYTDNDARNDMEDYYSDNLTEPDTEGLGEDDE